MTVHTLPVKRLLPATSALRVNILTNYRSGWITDATARQQLETHCGMSGVDAAREVANAVEVKA